MQTSHDPKGLLRESYRIEAISDAECRSILVDWALSLPQGADPRASLAAALDTYAAQAPDHPMTALLREGLAPPPTRPRKRRGATRDA